MDSSFLPPLDSLDLPFSKYTGKINRIVEHQYYSSTRRLVDTIDEHDLLEQIIDASKPIAPQENSRGKLDFLLFTPFRYPPLREGGRFHRLYEQSIFYGSSLLVTAMAEIAYRRFLFMAHSEAVFAPMSIVHTHFQVKVASEKAVWLTRPPFEAYRAQVSDPTSYAVSQPLGTRMRNAGAEVFTAFSARWPEGYNVGLFTPEAFAENRPQLPPQANWTAYVTPDRVEFSQRMPSQSTKAFQRAEFEENDIFPILG